MAWPTAEEIAQHFVTVGLLSAVPGDLDEIASLRAAMIERWERDSGFSPYLAPDAAETVAFNVRGGIQYVQFSAPVWSAGLDVSLDGTELIRDEGYRLRGIREPYRGIELACTGLDLAVNGVFGAVATIPDDVARAYLAGCAAEFASTRPSFAGNFTEQRVGEVTVKRGDDGSIRAEWASLWNAAIKRYGRNRVIA